MRHPADNMVDVLSEGGAWDSVAVGGWEGDVEGADAGVHEEDAAVEEGEFGGPDPCEASEGGKEVAVLPDVKGSEAGEGVEEEDVALIGVVEREGLDALAVLVEAMPVAFGGEAFEVLSKEPKGRCQYSRTYLSGKHERWEKTYEFVML